MRNTHDKSKPLFMFLTPHAPHAPYTPAPRHKGTLAGLQVPRVPSFNEPKEKQKTLPGHLKGLPEVDAGHMVSAATLHAARVCRRN